MLYSHPSRAHPVTANSITEHEIDFALTTSRKLLKAFRKCRRLFLSVLLRDKISGRLTLLLIYQNVSDECKERGPRILGFLLPRFSLVELGIKIDPAVISFKRLKSIQGDGKNKRGKNVLASDLS